MDNMPQHSLYKMILKYKQFLGGKGGFNTNKDKLIWKEIFEWLQ